MYGVFVARGAPLPEIAEQLGVGISSKPDFAVWKAHAVLHPWFPPVRGTDIHVVRLGCHHFSPVYNTCTLLWNNVKYVHANLDAPDNAISDNESSSEILTSQNQILKCTKTGAKSEDPSRSLEINAIWTYFVKKVFSWKCLAWIPLWRNYKRTPDRQIQVQISPLHFKGHGKWVFRTFLFSLRFAFPNTFIYCVYYRRGTIGGGISVTELRAVTCNI